MLKTCIQHTINLSMKHLKFTNFACVCIYIWMDGWMDGRVYIYIIIYIYCITIQNIYMRIVRTFLGFAWETWIYKHD